MANRIGSAAGSAADSIQTHSPQLPAGICCVLLPPFFAEDERMMEVA